MFQPITTRKHHRVIEHHPMKIGVVISSTLHVTILTWGLWNISAPKPFEVAKVETLPADFIPFDEFTRSVKGDAKARKREKPAWCHQVPRF